MVEVTVVVLDSGSKGEDKSGDKLGTPVDIQQ